MLADMFTHAWPTKNVVSAEKYIVEVGIEFDYSDGDYHKGSPGRIVWNDAGSNSKKAVLYINNNGDLCYRFNKHNYPIVNV